MHPCMHHKMRFTVEKIESRIKLLTPFIYHQKTAIPNMRLKYLEDEEVPDNITEQDNIEDWHEITPSSYWGPINRNFVMRTTFVVPPDYAPHAALHLPMGNAEDFAHPEALIYIDGKPLAAVDRFHQEIALPDNYCDGAVHHLTLHGWTGFTNSQGADAQLLMRQCNVVAIHQELRDFLITANAAWQILTRLADENPIRHNLLNALDEAFIALDTRDPIEQHVYNAVGEVYAQLKRRMEEAGQPLPVTISSVGHAHIDVAWLWTLGQTRRKSSRTFYTVLHLMKQFKNYIFTQSQPQLYEYMRQDHPELFEEIKQAVKDGRWELIGGMWIEADCNISGSESLARQFLLGRRFFREHFGKDQDSPVLWLPDVFGYSAQLPQLIRLAGMEYFFTIKIGWSQYNKLPYDRFWWQGLDGSRVITHFSTTPEGDNDLYASTYNAPARPEHPLRTWQRFKQKETQRDLLMVYGWGDGGGGPTREMLETIREMEDFPASPQTKHVKAGDFFRNLEQEVGHKLPTWNGELYLEYHRGTYTTQSRNKRANRKAEIALHNAEFLCTYAKIVEPHFDYPRAAFTEAWQLVCLNQFHDIIPGSSIGEVYVESLQQYERVMHLAATAEKAALEVFERYFEGASLIINSSGASAHGREEGRLATISPYSVNAYSNRLTNSPVKATKNGLENDFLQVEIADSGDITRICIKKSKREILPKGAIANQFQAFEDRPTMWDAWDIDIFYQDRMWLSDPASNIEILDNGLKITRKILNSIYTQTITLENSLLRFDTEIDWREQHILLKVAFPVDVLSSVATYDVQWGHVQRPTHWNTSWDWARFETVGHKWADLSEGDFGVALINDCKYGYDIRGNVMRLSLLKSPTFPDPNADQGVHQFSYALYPNTSLPQVIQKATTFNNPVTIHKGSLDLPSTSIRPLVEAFDNGIIETIKLAEDDDSVIVRLYEPYHVRGWTRLYANFEVASASIVNLLEDEITPLEVENNGVRIFLAPFQIVTVKLTPKRDSL